MNGHMLPLHDLTRLPMFQGLRPEQLEPLTSVFRRVSFSSGAKVFSEGDAAKFLYLVEAGEVRITFCPYDGESLEITRIAPGGGFGWSAALGREHYTATATCLSPVRALAIRGDDLRRLMRSDPILGEWLLEWLCQILASRFGDMRHQLVQLLGKEASAEA